MKRHFFKKILPGFALFAMLLLSCIEHTNMHSATSAREVMEKPFSNPLAVPATLDGTNASFAAAAGQAMLEIGRAHV